MKILCFSDTHYCVKNIPYTRELHSKIIPLITSSNIDFVVMLGDFFDNKRATETPAMIEANKLIYEISQIKKIFLIVGNHDIVNETEPVREDNHSLVLFKQWENVIVVDKVIRYDKFIFCPYVPVGYGLIRSS